MAACSSGETTAATPCTWPMECPGPAACVAVGTGTPRTGVCAEACEADLDCPAPQVCARTDQDVGFCAPPCDHDDSTSWAVYGVRSDAVDYGCEAGRPVHWSKLAMPDCRVMTPCNSDQYCCTDGVVGCTRGTCVAKRAAGEPCAGAFECESWNCGTPQAGGQTVCLVPGGAECTSSNCARCVSHGSFSLCEPLCGIGVGTCPGPGQACVANDNVCRPYCNGGFTCPAHFTCPYPGDSFTWVCVPTGT